VYLVLRSILLDTETHEYIPQNSGLTKPIHIHAPLGSICNPTFPAPTIARFCPGNIVASTLMHALAKAAPRQVSAGVGNLKVVAYSGLAQGNYWVYMDITEGSYGGRFGKDGLDCVDTLYANTRNNPIEDIESHYPLRVQRYEIREDGGGAGTWRGGAGSIREVMFLSPGHASVEGDGQRHAPWGLFGGTQGSCGDLVLNPQSNLQKLPAMISNLSLHTGDTLRTVSPCGGGYGDPLKRDPVAVLNDVLDGFVSSEKALRDYKVVITDRITIDQKATKELRGRG
jgi:N-methylhydantoinase B